MQRKSSKFFALLCTAILLVTSLAITIPMASAAVVYEYSMSATKATPVEVAEGSALTNQLASEFPGNRWYTFRNAEDRTKGGAGSLVYATERAITDYCFDMVISYTTTYSFYASADNSSWTQITPTLEDNGDWDKAPWKTYSKNAYGTLDAADGYKYLKVTLSTTDGIYYQCAPAVNYLKYNMAAVEPEIDAAVVAVKEAIAALPAPDAITPADVAAIEAAGAAYDALSEGQKLDVDNAANLDALLAAADAFRPTLQGAQYRAIGGGKGDGVRFGATVTGKAADAYKGYTLAGYGFVYAKAENWTDGALTRESSFAKYKEGTSMLPAEGDELTFYGSIVNITEALADVELMGRAYLIYEKDGQKVYVYSTENSDMNGNATASMAWIRSLNKTIELANAD